MTVVWDVWAAGALKGIGLETNVDREFVIWTRMAMPLGIAHVCFPSPEFSGREIIPS